MPLSSRTALRAPSHPATHAAVTSSLVPSACLRLAWTCVPVDDPHAHAAPNELIREHQPGGAGPDDEDISMRFYARTHLS